MSPSHSYLKLLRHNQSSSIPVCTENDKAALTWELKLRTFTYRASTSTSTLVFHDKNTTTFHSCSQCSLTYKTVHTSAFYPTTILREAGITIPSLFTEEKTDSKHWTGSQNKWVLVLLPLWNFRQVNQCL